MTNLASMVERVTETRLPTAYGPFRAVGYLDAHGHEHVALVYGEVAGTAPLTRLHSECLTGDVFASTRCDCGDQFAAAMRAVFLRYRTCCLRFCPQPSYRRPFRAGSTSSASSWTDFHASSIGIAPTSGCITM